MRTFATARILAVPFTTIEHITTLLCYRVKKVVLSAIISIKSLLDQLTKAWRAKRPSGL